MTQKMTGITHCSFYCKDFQRMLAFYRDALEIKHLFTLRHPDGTVWLSYLQVAPRQFIELFSDVYHGDNDWKQISFSHVSLAVANLEEAVKTLEDKGICIYHGPETDFAPYRLPFRFDPSRSAATVSEAWLKDPEGNVVRLAQAN